MRTLLMIGAAFVGGCAQSLPDAKEAYLACVRSEAATVGTKATIGAAEADQIVAKCKVLLRPAAEQMAQAGRMTNLPAGMESAEGRLSVAMSRIEHAAKMEISDHVLPLPVA